MGPVAVLLSRSSLPWPGSERVNWRASSLSDPLNDRSSLLDARACGVQSCVVPPKNKRRVLSAVRGHQSVSNHVVVVRILFSLHLDQSGKFLFCVGSLYRHFSRCV